MHDINDGSGTVIRIGPVSITAHDVLRSLHQRQQLMPLLRGAAVEKLIRLGAEHAGIVVSSEELQAESHHFRRTRGLHRRSDTYSWLHDEQLSLENWEDAIELNLLKEKLANILFEKHGACFFAAEMKEYGRVRLSKMILPSMEIAHEIRTQVAEEGYDFSELAVRQCMDPALRLKGGDLGLVFVADLPVFVRECISDRASESILGPYKTSDGSEIYKLGSVVPPVFDPPTKRRVRHDVFQQWIGREIQKASFYPPGSVGSPKG